VIGVSADFVCVHVADSDVTVVADSDVTSLNNTPRYCLLKVPVAK